MTSTAIIDRIALTNALAIAANAVEKRNYVPALNCFHMEAKGANVIVSATDLDMEISVTVPALTDEGFATMLPADKLQNIVKKVSTGDTIAIETPEHEEAKAKITLGKSSYNLNALPVSDAAESLAFSSNRGFIVSGATLFDMIDGTINSISKEETRYYLNGIYMHEIRGELVFVSTDGHRLQKMAIAAPDGCEDMTGIILPKKVCDILHKLLKGKAKPDEIRVSLSDTSCGFAFENVTITTKAIDGTFPDYNRVIPLGNDIVARFKAPDVLAAIVDASIVADSKYHSIRITVEEETCDFIVKNSDGEFGRSRIACTLENSEEIEFGVNAGYLTDIVKEASPDGGEIVLALRDSGSPIVITGTRKGWLGVQMPMRV